MSHPPGTKDPDAAKLRNIDALRKQALFWQRLRKRPEPLPHKQIIALSGVICRDQVAMMEPEPGAPRVWTEVQKLLDRIATGPNGPERL